MKSKSPLNTEKLKDFGYGWEPPSNVETDAVDRPWGPAFELEGIPGEAQSNTPPHARGRTPGFDARKRFVEKGVRSKERTKQRTWGALPQFGWGGGWGWG